MAIEIKRKSVAFNIDDPDQMALLEHASKRANFSSYIKRLIQRDLEGGQYVSNVQTPSYQPEDNEYMTGLI